MKKRTLLLLLLAAVCFLLSGWLSRSGPAGTGLLYYGQRLEQVLAAQQAQSQRWLHAHSYSRILTDGLPSPVPDQSGFFLFSGDSLLYWTDPVMPQPQLNRSSSVSIQLLSDGYYYVTSHTSTKSGKALTGLLALPVFRTYPSSENPDLKAHFPLLSLPEGVVFSADPPGIPVTAGEGVNVQGYLSTSFSLAHPGWMLLSFFLFACGCCIFLPGILAVSRQLSSRPAGLVLMLFAMLALHLAGSLTLFHPSAPQVCGTFHIGETGSLIFNLFLLIIFLFWAGWQADRLAPAPEKPQLPGRQFLIASAGYALIIAGPVVYAICIRHVILFSGLSFDFSNPFNLSAESFAVLIFTLMILTPVLELSQKITAYIHFLNLGGWKRLLAGSAGILLALPVALWSLPELPGPEIFFIGLFYLLLLDLFTDYRRESLTWLIIWLVFFSAFSSVLLFLYSRTHDVSSPVPEQVGADQPLELFSFLFVILLLLVLITTSLRGVLSGKWQWPQFSLRFRLQLTVTALIGGGFILIGIITANSLQQSARKENNDRLQEAVRSTLLELNRLSSQPEAILDLDDLASRLAKGRQMEITLYRTDGTLAAVSEGPLSRQEVYPPRVVPELLHPAFRREGQLVTRRHQAGGLSYRTVYAGISGAGPVAFAGLSFIGGEGTLNRTLYTFLGTLINIYVFLLLAASVIAIAVANSIARPLDSIVEKLQTLGLGRNEPLEWQSDDEIGQLVRAYNDMIAKLEESTEKLRQSEREDAWREMARQVAHEIKNPLTPMKLSIQHLDRVSRSDPARAAELIRRVTQTLVEQIDGLSRIANEFSTFAKMPKAENDYFTLNDLVASVFHLFKENPEHDVTLELKLPAEQLVIFADRSQLMRVLNNLIRNALQAIPAERQGHIQVGLCRRDQQAVLTVSDNGSGIPREVRQKVFYPNFTTKSSGMGLGLAMCKNIIDQCGGRIYFETEEGTGTEFIIEIPVSKPEAGSRKSEERSDSDFRLPPPSDIVRFGGRSPASDFTNGFRQAP